MDRERPTPADWLFLLYVALLPLMKLPIGDPVILADVLFLLLALVMAAEWALGWRRLDWTAPFAVLLLYLLSHAPSLAATPDLGRSMFKLATEAYLVGLAAVAVVLVRSEDMLRRVVITWLWATAALACLAVASLVAFYLSAGSPLYQYSQFHFGTLPEGHYPRLALTFFNANMACNYLTVSLGLLFVAWQRGWLPEARSWLLLMGILIAAAVTISPGLGGILLALGCGFWMRRRSRLAIFLGGAGALAFVVALAVTPIVHPTAPFLIEVPGTDLVLAPSGRFLTWSAAWAEFLRHPMAGHGIGIDAVAVEYFSPSGYLQHLTDAHNVVLSIAAQAGISGLAGLAFLLAYAARLTFSSRADGDPTLRLGLGLTFLNAFLYQGLGGSFEDTRHLWVLLGLLIAVSRPPVSHPDENSRRAGAPSPC